MLLTLFKLALVSGFADNLAKALVYLNQGEKCDDCGEEYYKCFCEYCEDCKFQKCLCNYDIQNEEKVRKETWRIAKEVLNDINLMRLADDTVYEARIAGINSKFLQKLSNNLELDDYEKLRKIS